MNTRLWLSSLCLVTSLLPRPVSAQVLLPSAVAVSATSPQGQPPLALFEKQWQLQVTKVELVPKWSERYGKSQRAFGAKEGETLFVVQLEVSNLSKDKRGLQWLSAEAVADDDGTYALTGLDMAQGDQPRSMAVVAPGEKRALALIFAVSPDDKFKALRLKLGNEKPGEAAVYEEAELRLGSQPPVVDKPLVTLPPNLKPTLLLQTNWDFEKQSQGWSATSGSEAMLEAICPIPRPELPPTPPAPVPLGGDYWVPVRDSAVQVFQAQGTWFCDTGAPTAGQTGRNGSRRGRLSSVSFPLQKPFLQVLLAGRRGSSTSGTGPRLELQLREPATSPYPRVDSEFVRIGFLEAPQDDTLRRMVLPISAELMGKTVRVQIIDEDPSGYIVVDDIQLTETATPLPLPPAPSLKRPLWGFADTHTHPAAQLAWGGMYWGSNTGDPATALHDCTPAHGIGGTGLRDVGAILGLVRNGVSLVSIWDDWVRLFLTYKGVSNETANAVLGTVRGTLSVATEGPAQSAFNGIRSAFGLPEPTAAGFLQRALGWGPLDQDAIAQLAYNAVEESFGHRTGGVEHNHDGWPRFNSRTHQHMHEQWIRRSYDGGLRLMVAHVVNTELLGNLMPRGSRNVSDWDAINAQLTELEALARRNSSWMGIAKTPAEARRLIEQNKLALVLGVEVDSLGNLSKKTNPTEADVLDELNTLYQRGVRHIFPIHLADNDLGGSALYNMIFDLNHFALRGTLHPMRPDADARAAGVEYRSMESFLDLPSDMFSSLAQTSRRLGLDRLRLPGGMLLDTATLLEQVRAIKPDYASKSGHMNAQGLTPKGEAAIQRLMDLGMVIDIDHMSDLTQQRVLALAESRAQGSVQGYPLIAGHCSFRGLCTTHARTSDHHKVPCESDVSPQVMARLRALGGMVAPSTLGKDAQTTSRLDAPGSSTSWATAYRYAIQQMGGKSVALSTDMAMLGGLGPRFGPLGAHAMEGDTLLQQTRGLTRLQAVDSQRSPVAYRTRLSDTRGYRWEGDAYERAGDRTYNADQRNAFQAVALGLGNKPLDALPLEPAGGPIFEWNLLSATGSLLVEAARTIFDVPGKWMINIAKGIRGVVENPVVDLYKGPDIQHAARAARQWVDTNPSRPFGASDYLPFLEQHRRTNRNEPDAALYQRAFEMTRRAYLVLAPSGSGAPNALTRSTIGPRDLDFNLDGLAHYGLLPDMLQDIKNTGMRPEELAPLFRSAEDYIRMWEKCDALKLTAGAKLNTLPNLKDILKR
ncbi:membrane dipeptidase [Armatimonas rosea]|uniref:Microsomal dipeptidase-like Zn-dependent dipeptidase n=1 Tax=Armatimonas rosea TaxID=685828 RepID=A0A7W9W500_ARMRO|nr:membrane dipeptidase [Armatimonas rosea]MBB6048511.1 microsomal dipeptidase-like Zn-dependent dipeptidase [Armatimonas rosea]